MRYAFHPEARLEYREAAAFHEARRPGLGAAFTREVEAAIERVLEAPERWRLIEQDVRRCLTHTFPEHLAIVGCFARRRSDVRASVLECASPLALCEHAPESGGRPPQSKTPARRSEPSCGRRPPTTSGCTAHIHTFPYAELLLTVQHSESKVHAAS